MATVTAKSKNENIECFYDSNYDNTTFALFLPNNSNFAAARVDKYEIENLIQTLKDFDERMRRAGAIR